MRMGLAVRLFAHGSLHEWLASRITARLIVSRQTHQIVFHKIKYIVISGHAAPLAEENSVLAIREVGKHGLPPCVSTIVAGENSPPPYIWNPQYVTDSNILYVFMKSEAMTYRTATSCRGTAA